MAEIKFYRVARNGEGYSRSYDSVGSARNLISNNSPWGTGSWRGVNSKTFKESIYDWKTETHNSIQAVYTIQKLTPVLKPLEGGSLQLDMEWVDLV